MNINNIFMMKADMMRAIQMGIMTDSVLNVRLLMVGVGHFGVESRWFSMNINNIFMMKADMMRAIQMGIMTD